MTSQSQSLVLQVNKASRIDFPLVAVVLWDTVDMSVDVAPSEQKKKFQTPERVIHEKSILGTF